MREDENNPDFEALLDYIKRNRGFDLTGYKRSSLMRRVRKRMQMLEIENFSNYMDRLEVAPDEFVVLFNTILIIYRADSRLERWLCFWTRSLHFSNRDG